MRRFVLAAIATVVLAGPALAQTPLTGPTPPTTSAPPLAGTAAAPNTPPATAPATDLPSTPAQLSTTTGARRGRMTQAARFQAANTTHDGKLTLDQARAAHMNAVVRDFSAIDKSNRGYVTLADIREHRRAVRAARKTAAAKQ